MVEASGADHLSHPESSVFSSTSPAAHQAYVRSSSTQANTNQPEVNAIAQEASKRLDKAIVDDFAENETCFWEHEFYAPKMRIPDSQPRQQGQLEGNLGPPRDQHGTIMHKFRVVLQQMCQTQNPRLGT